MEPFQRLEDASMQLMESTDITTEPTKKGSVGISQSIAQITGLERQMRQQLKDIQVNLHTRVQGKETINGSLNVSFEHLHPLLENAICAVKNKELSIYRMQCAHAIRDQIGCKKEEHLEISEVIAHSIEICKKIRSMQMSNRILVEKIFELRKNRIELKLNQEALLQEVKKLEKEKHGLGEWKMKTKVLENENIQESIDMLFVFQEVFLRIVWASKVHWAEDPKVAELLVNMAKFPDL